METENDYFLLNDPITRSDNQNMSSENEYGDNLNLDSTIPNTMDKKNQVIKIKEFIFCLSVILYHL